VVSAALLRSADEVDTLAASFECGNDRNSETVNGTLARLAQSESLNHLAKATDAWAARQRAQAGQELQSAVEQFEHAAEDDRTALHESATQAVAEALSIAVRLNDSAAVSTDEFLRGVTALDTEVRRLGSRMDR
jgi:hypothetical protein